MSYADKQSYMALLFVDKFTKERKEQLVDILLKAFDYRAPSGFHWSNGQSGIVIDLYPDEIPYLKKIWPEVREITTNHLVRGSSCCG